MTETEPLVDTPPAAPAPTPMDPVEAARKLGRFITCKPSLPVGGCGGIGWVWVKNGTMRHKAICPCIQREFERQKARAQAAANEQGKRAAELVAAADALPGEPQEPRHVPQGARDRLARLKRELAKIDAGATRARERQQERVQAAADLVAALEAKREAISEEEIQNQRDATEAEATKKLAGAQLEEVRARLAGLQTQIHEAEAAQDRLAAEAGQFGARRMEVDADLVKARAVPVPPVDERETMKRREDLQARLDHHFAYWPELRGDAPS